jgi:RHS repeat-associated protein
MQRSLLVLLAVILLPIVATAQTTQVVEYYHTDAQGNVRAVTKQVDGQWQVVVRYDYMPFGELFNPQTPPTQKRLFLGQERDSETGLDHLNARYFGSGLGRFTSPDPLGGRARDPQSLNRYAYARNSPLRYSDPGGLDFYLSCQSSKDNQATCQDGHVGASSNGKFSATLVHSTASGRLVDQYGTVYSATIDGAGVHFTAAGGRTSALGVFANGTPRTTIEGTGAFSGFTFEFSRSDMGSNITADGTFRYNGAAAQAQGALNAAGYSGYVWDNFNVLHPSTATYTTLDYRSPGAAGTGAGSGHFTVFEPASHDYLGYPPFWMRIRGEASVPTGGTAHFGEHNPWTGGLWAHGREVWNYLFGGK